MRSVWRAAANFDGPDGKIDTIYGTPGTFVTKPSPKIDNPGTENFSILKKSAPPGYDLVVAIGAVSREGSVSVPATVPLPVRTVTGRS